jgi:hypothetical protein
MLGHIEDKRRRLLSLEKSLLNTLCAAFDPFEICGRSCSCALVDIREGLLRADPYCVQSRQVRRSVHGTSATYRDSGWPVWCALQNRSLKRSSNHSRKGARMFAIRSAISLSRGTQSSFPHIIIRTMWAGNCPPGGINSRTAEMVGSVKRSPLGSSSWGGSGCIGFLPLGQSGLKSAFYRFPDHIGRFAHGSR